MSRTTRRFTVAGAYALGLALLGLFSAATHAAPINYGNVGPIPPGVTFEDVTETANFPVNAEPLYGPPDPFVIGLDFDPAGFAAGTINGGADLVDGQLNFTIDSDVAISTISLFERGDYSLIGAGTAATQVIASAIMNATVTELNGNGIPVNMPLTGVNGAVGFNLVANPGSTQPWSLGLSIDVAGEIAGATRIKVDINNQLSAVSEAATIAFIAKKDFVIDAEVVPEPSSFALIGMLLVGFGAARKQG